MNPSSRNQVRRDLRRAARIGPQRAAGTNSRSEYPSVRPAGASGVRLGKEDRVTLLLARSVDVNARDVHGRTALMEAVTGRWDSEPAIMKLLLDKGADINAADDKGQTSVDQAVWAGSLDRVKLLLERSAKVKDKSATLGAARNQALLNAAGDASAMKPLLDQGADPNYTDEAAETALMLSAAKDHSLNAVRLLLDRGAAPNRADKSGNTALMFAVDQYDADVVRALLDKGADPNARDHHRNTVLIRAAASRHSFVCSPLSFVNNPLPL